LVADEYEIKHPAEIFTSRRLTELKLASLER
jgi:hypothetical protein